MRALFVGGTVDNSELDLEQTVAPLNYPSHRAHVHAQYRLYEVGQRDGATVCAIYAARELGSAEVERIVAERDYARRFGAERWVERGAGM